MRPRFQRGDRDRQVRVGRRGDDDDVGTRVQQLLERRKAWNPGWLLPRVVDADDLHLGELAQRGDMNDLGGPSDARNRHPHFAHARDPRAGR